MRNNQNFAVLFIMMLIGQILISNYFHFTPYLSLSVLPAIILCMPLSVNTNLCMAAAFVAGTITDMLGEGVYGMNAVALIPVALSRKSLIRIIMGEDHITRSEDFSFNKNGPAKIAMALVIAQSIFWCIYIFVDGAGTRPFWFNAVRFISSAACSTLISIPATMLLTPNDRK